MFLTFGKHLHCFFNTFNRNPNNTRHIDTHTWVFSDSYIFIFWINQILNQFKINLDEWDFNVKSILVLFLCLGFKDLLKCSWNDTFVHRISKITNHCMSLTSTSLSICKYCPIKAFKNWIKHWSCTSIVNIWLNRLRSKYGIKSKLLLIPFLFDHDGTLICVESNDHILGFLFVLKFLLWKRS